MRVVATAALALLAPLGCKGRGDDARPMVAPAVVADAAARAVETAPSDAAAPVIDAAPDGPTGPVTLDLCPAIEAVQAASPSFFADLRGADAGPNGQPLATIQLTGAVATVDRSEPGHGDWTARWRSVTAADVRGLIAAAGRCAAIAGWAQQATTPENHSWTRVEDLEAMEHGETRVRMREVWIAGSKGTAALVISVDDAVVQPGD